ncbi:MAG: response regulator transcription factor NblR [Microcoleaceae cyanobacterium]
MSTITSDQQSPILIVESDELLARLVAIDLEEAGYQSVIASDSSTGLQQVAELQPAMIVTERAMGNESGLSLCRRLRVLGYHNPILVFMARDTVEDRVACLESGADDYFVKPYQTERFLQLINLYLQSRPHTTEQLRFGELVLDLSTRRALRNGRAIELTMKEFELLKYLMEHPREVLTREQILENVWGYDFLGESNVIEVYIRYLRLKIENEGEKRLIQTVRGVGYVLRES